MMGEFETPMEEHDFFSAVKKKWSRWNSTFTFTGKQIKSSSSRWFWKLCYKKCNYGWADAFLTADLKYHQFWSRKPTTLADIGHFESERYTKNILLIIFGKKSLILQSFYQKKIQIQLSTYRIWRIRKNVEDKLRAIYDLQLIDSRIDEIRNVRWTSSWSGRSRRWSCRFKHTFWKLKSELKLSKILSKEKRMQLTSTKRLSKIHKTTGNCS
jgi:hypothetical protein